MKYSWVVMLGRLRNLGVPTTPSAIILV